MEYPPPLCFATQNIGEVTRSGGGVDFYQKLFSYFFTVHRGDRNVLVSRHSLKWGKIWESSNKITIPHTETKVVSNVGNDLCHS